LGVVANFGDGDLPLIGAEALAELGNIHIFGAAGAEGEERTSQGSAISSKEMDKLEACPTVSAFWTATRFAVGILITVAGIGANI
jgi:hypothetical protein